MIARWGVWVLWHSICQQRVQPGYAEHMVKRARPVWTVIVLLLVLMPVGCHAPGSIVGDAPYREAPELITDTQRDAQPRAQVFITYDPVMNSHAAMRLTGLTAIAETPEASGRTMMWDPAGFYGEGNAAVLRQRDVIIQGSPTLADWLAYRIDQCGENAVLMIEFDLTAEQLESLSEPLITAATATAGLKRFNPSTGGGFCCVRLTGYLEQHGDAAWGIKRGQLMPHDLARRVWRAGGYSRAVWFAPGRPPRVYEPRQDLANKVSPAGHAPVSAP